MTKRVALSASGLRVSKAGVNVDTASGTDLLFDSQGSAYNGIYLVGRIPASSFTETTATATVNGQTRTTITRTYTVVFGKTFPAVPRIKWGILDPTASNLAFVSSPVFNSIGQSATAGQLTGAALTMAVAVSTTQAVFTITYVYYSGSGFTLTLDVPYIVFQV